VARYNPSTATITATTDVTLFSATPECVTAFHPATVGWIGSIDYTILSVDINMESLAVAMAVNLGILKVEYLDIAQLLNIGLPVTTDDGTFPYILNKYFDIRFESMEPIYCCVNGTRVPVGYPTVICAISISGSSLALPVFNPFGETSIETFLIACTCPSSEECQSFKFLSGYVFFDINLWDSDGDPLSYVVESIGLLGTVLFYSAFENRSAYEVFNERMFYATKSVALLSTQLPGFEDIDLNGVIKAIVETYCTATYQNVTRSCAIITFLSFSFELQNQVSTYHFTMPEGACTDTFTIPDSNW
jgi:hypothetical protein